MLNLYTVYAYKRNVILHSFVTVCRPMHVLYVDCDELMIMSRLMFLLY